MASARRKRAIERDQNEAHAVYARAWATTLRGRPLDARGDAERAVQLGRGEPAELLLGMILYGAGDLAARRRAVPARARAGTRRACRRRTTAPIIADKQSRYHDAREGYLRALQLDPKLADARYNLVLMTHAHGATLEAKHHLRRFRGELPGRTRGSRS